jgi:hypothetical protein
MEEALIFDLRDNQMRPISFLVSTFFHESMMHVSIPSMTISSCLAGEFASVHE